MRLWVARLPVLLPVLLLALAAMPPAWSAPQPAQALIARAYADLAKSDGIAAEVRLRQALAAGATRIEIAAGMGEAYLDQGNRQKAREWLEPGSFARGDEVRGFRMLAMLERLERNLPAAGRAYDRALAVNPRDSMLWVDIGRLRYQGGEQLQAVDAVERALAADPANIRALEFRAQLVRDRYGLLAALPWFEAALVKAPEDIALLGEYAATLGELGRARDMLVVTRRMLDLEPGNARAWFLQAVLAARAGKVDLARSLLNRTGTRLRNMPAAILLDGALNLKAGNWAQAIEQLDRLLRMQPGNDRARLLLARAMAGAGQNAQLVARFGPAADRPDASPYLLTLLGRAHEDMGRRDLAAPLLERAASAAYPPIVAIDEDQPLGVLALRWRDQPNYAATAVPYIRKLLGSGAIESAQTISERLFAANRGAGDALSLAGDVQLARGDLAAAILRYEAAARVRLDDGLLLRLVTAYNRAGASGRAEPVVENYLAQHPQSRIAARLAAAIAAQSGDWPRARLLLENLCDGVRCSDSRLLADLAFARLKAGDAVAAADAARQAYRVQRASPVAAQAWGTALVTSRSNPDAAAALLEKARVMGGDNDLLMQARKALNAQGKR